MKERKKQLEELLEIVRPYEKYFPNEMKTEARAALEKFFKNYKKVSFDEEYRGYNQEGYFAHYFYILRIRDYLLREEYAGACDDIATLIRLGVIFQERVYNALMDLRGRYMEEKYVV